MTHPVLRNTIRQIIRASTLTTRWSIRFTLDRVQSRMMQSGRFPELPELPPSRVVDLRGRGRVFVVDTGVPRPGAPTLLLLHGLATTSFLTWFTTLDQLRADYRVVMLDQRWHGRGIVGDRFSLDDCADDAAALLDHLGIDRAIAVGYSMGGALAQVFWRRHPERTAGLVLASTAPHWKGSRGEAMFYPLLNLANDRFRAHYRARVAARRESLPDLPTPSQKQSSWAWAEFRSTSGWALPEVLGELGGFDSRPWLGEIDVPVAVVVTAADHTMPASRQFLMAASIPGATVHEAPGGHASLAYDVARWRPIFLGAVAEVADRASGGSTDVTSLRPVVS